jgi:hypothetical protein
MQLVFNAVQDTKVRHADDFLEILSDMTRANMAMEKWALVPSIAWDTHERIDSLCLTPTLNIQVIMCYTPGDAD